MTRIVKEHQQRKNEILDTAQALFYQHGYEQTSVATVIDTIGIAKGTFYHYFTSKADLLNQIIRRQSQRIDQEIDRVLDEPEENALVELNNIWKAIGEYRMENKEVILLMTKTLYSDDNIILRTKLLQMRIKVVAKKISRVIARGISEGIFDTGHPDDVAEMILNMSTYLSDEFARLVVEDNLTSDAQQRYLEKCRIFENAVARILGIPEGSVVFCNKDIINAFFER
jgi:AcrR family transcriptional regulator